MPDATKVDVPKPDGLAPAGGIPAGAAAGGGEAPPDPERAKRDRERRELADYASRKDREAKQKRAEAEARARKDAEREAEIAKLRARAAVADQLEKELEDPLELLHKRGVTADKIGERIIKQGTPEAKTEELAKELRELKEARDRDQRESAERLQRARAEAEMAAAERALLAARDELKAEAPILAKFGRERLIREYMITYQRAKEDPETGPYADTYTNAELLKATEARIAAEREEALDEYDDDTLTKHLTKRASRASSTAESGKPDATGRQSEEAASSRKAAPLTHAVTATTTGSWKPSNWDKLSDRQQNEILVERLKKGLPCD